MSSGKEFLFPGTGFFRKNRDPIPEEQAKEWFITAEAKLDQGEIRKALDLYENFSKRRSNAVLVRKGKKIQIGPEALFRAAILRENKGDWRKAFEHLRLIAEAYTEYNFEKIAESLMRVAERLARRSCPASGVSCPVSVPVIKIVCAWTRLPTWPEGPSSRPRALMALAEIAKKDGKEDEAVDALERLVNLYPENYLCEEAYFLLAKIYEGRVSGPSYDQGSTLKALNFYEDYIILYSTSPPRSKHESAEDYQARLAESKIRRSLAEKGRRKMRKPWLPARWRWASSWRNTESITWYTGESLATGLPCSSTMRPSPRPPNPKPPEWPRGKLLN